MHLLKHSPRTMKYFSSDESRCPSTASNEQNYVNYLLVCFEDLMDSLRFNALFCQPQPFVFIILRTLSQKYRGVGTPHVGKPSRLSAFGHITILAETNKPADFDVILWCEH
jgi:hypothetical protein